MWNGYGIREVSSTGEIFVAEHLDCIYFMASLCITIPKVILTSTRGVSEEKQAAVFN